MSQSQRRHNDDRMRRAKSWYEHSLDAQCDDDKFIFLWIAFAASGGAPRWADGSRTHSCGRHRHEPARA